MARMRIGPYPVCPPACHEADPRAVAAARRVARLITDRLPTVTVEHIGSTAVPDCAGKGIVDLMVLYPDGELEGVKAVLASLGFQRQTRGHLHPESRPMRVGAIVEGGRTFALHVHVLAVGSEEVVRLRAFRDRLRDDPALRAAYVARKREILAHGVTDPAAYTGIKSAFVEAVLTGAGLLPPTASRKQAPPSALSARGPAGDKAGLPEA
jgi:GrpB-like predicted nucleotidyltransferase (UPF0157 family)